MKASTTTIVAIILSFLVGGALLAYYFEFVIPEREIFQRCANHVPDWTVFVECHGVIVIKDGWDMDYLSFNDHIHDYEIARIYRLKQYMHSDDTIYVINRKTIEGSSSNGIRTLYYQKLFQNGKVVENSYDSIEKIPTYLVINYKSGEVRAYKNINEVPEDERRFFSELEKISSDKSSRNKFGNELLNFIFN